MKDAMLFLCLCVIVFLSLRLHHLHAQIKTTAKAFKEASANLNSEQHITLEVYDKELESLSQTLNQYIETFFKKQREDALLLEETRTEITNLSHDLRTPLTSILGYVDLLKDEDLDAEQQDYLNIIRSRSTVLKDRITQLYEYCMIQEKDFEIPISKFCLSHFLKEYLLSYYSELKKQNIELHLRLPEENIFILGNEKYITRVFDNLLSNTMKYADGYLEIHLDDTRVTLRTHRGLLSEVDVHHMFDRFYRKNPDASTTFSSGLGLTITSILMQKMGGTIHAEADQEYLDLICAFKKAEQEIANN